MCGVTRESPAGGAAPAAPVAADAATARPQAQRTPPSEAPAAARRPSPAPAGSGAAGGAPEVFPGRSPARAAGAVVGIPAATNTLPIVAVANYFAELPGIDLTPLTARQKETFLQRVNSELCTCGCKNDTLAKCYVNDPGCPVVRGLVLTVLDEVKHAE